MKCEICQKKEATIKIKQVHNGQVKVLCLCEECAAASGLDLMTPPDLSELLMGAIPAKPDHIMSVPACPHCGMKWSYFKRTSRLGCPQCYETFKHELLAYIAGFHYGSTQHCGKIPFSAKLESEMAALDKALQDAVNVQNFELAAKLRDRIKELKKIATSLKTTKEQNESKTR
jgi:protein arginine kinase activator